MITCTASVPLQEANAASKICDSEINGDVQNCLWDKLHNDTLAKKLEEEYYNDSLALTMKCFDRINTTR